MNHEEITPGTHVEWWRYDGGEVPRRCEGDVWSQAPTFRGMRAWWVQNDEGTFYVARASKRYTTGVVLNNKWHNDGDVIEIGEMFEETHKNSKMVTALNKLLTKFFRKRIATHQGETEMDSFYRICDSQ